METLMDKVKGALYGLLIADALAAPTHWFYGGPAQIKALYGSLITGYVDPVQHLPGSIMSKSSTGGGGRGTFKGDIIGSVIFHGKKKYWAPGADYHYHNLLKAGDNTLEALLTRRTMAVMAENGGFDFEALQNDYLTFMQTPDSHNDTYAGTCHRMFFANLKAGKPPSQCPDNDHHNVDTIDALVTTVPVALFPAEDDVAKKSVREMVSITRDSSISQEHAAIFASMLRRVVGGEDLRAVLKDTGKTKFGMNNMESFSSRADTMTACYMDSSFPAMLIMAYKYADTFEKGLLANANRGGENVGSGALLGALLGAQVGFSKIPKHLVDGLAPSQRPRLDEEIEDFLAKSRLLNTDSCM